MPVLGGTFSAVPLAAAASGQDPVQADTTAAVGSLAVGARADHVHPSAGQYWWLGGGTVDAVFDGSTTVVFTDASGATNNIAPSGSVYTLPCAVAFKNITVSTGITVQAAGYIIYASGTLTLTGTGKIIADGGNASGATGGTAGGNGSLFPVGGVGGTGTTGVGGGGGAPVGNTQIGYISGVAGAGGASGGTAGGTTNKLSGKLITNLSLVYYLTMPEVYVTGIMPNLRGTGGPFLPGSGGGAGGGDGTNAGGGGGGGGGVVLINCRNLAGSGSVTANGGNGANGVAGNAGGGGPGGGGVAIVNTTSTSGWTGTVLANGGNPGTGSGTGSTGSTNPGSGVSNCNGFAKLTVFS